MADIAGRIEATRDDCETYLKEMMRHDSARRSAQSPLDENTPLFYNSVNAARRTITQVYIGFLSSISPHAVNCPPVGTVRGRLGWRGSPTAGGFFLLDLGIYPCISDMYTVIPHS